MKINLASNELIHFLGIGGIGMSGLAMVMKRMGFKNVHFLTGNFRLLM